VNFSAVPHPTAEVGKKVVAHRGVVQVTFLFDPENIARQHQAVGEGAARGGIGDEIPHGQTNSNEGGTRTFGKKAAQPEIPIQITRA